MSTLVYSDRSPAEIALDFYGDDFYDLVDLHFMFGYVQATPDYFIMGRPVNKEAPHQDLVDIRITYNEHKQNSWFIYFLSGDMNKALDNIPFYLPYCTFEHKGSLKSYSLDKFKQRIRRTYGIRSEEIFNSRP